LFKGGLLLVEFEILLDYANALTKYPLIEKRL